MESEQQTMEKLRQSLRQAEEQQQQQQSSLAEAEKEIARIDRMIAEKQARLEVLRQMTEEGEGLEKGSQAVLKGLNDPDRIRPAIAGALVANLNVDREFIPALEAAFGRAMHAVVLNNTALAAEIFQTLTENKSGQAALAIPEWSADLPKTPIVKPAERRTGLGDRQGRRAGDFGANRSAPAARCRDCRRSGHRARAQEARPDIFNMPRSAANLFPRTESSSAEARARPTDSLLGRKAILTDLCAGTRCARSRTTDVDRNARPDRRSRSKPRSVRSKKRAKSQEAAQQDHSQASVQILSAERAVQDAEQKLTSSGDRKEAPWSSRSGALTKESPNWKRKWDRSGKRSRKNCERKSVAEQARENARSQEEETAEKLNELRLAVATERQRHESLVNHRQPMAAREAELADLVAARRGDIATYQNRLATQARESEEAEARILSQASQLEAAGEAVAALAEERGARLAAVNEQESQVRALRDSLNDLRDLRGKQEVRQTQLQLRIENLAEHVMRRYQIDLRAFTTDSFAFQKTLSVVTKRRAGGSTRTLSGSMLIMAAKPRPIPASPAERPIHPEVESLEQIIADLTRQLDNMGPVNLEAVHEYDELEERYRFLETQNNDLIAARREVLDVITRINSTTQKLFAETFAQVRINFREMFGELFDGGRADLSLVGRERSAQLRHRNQRETARETIAKHFASLRRRAHDDGGRAALRHLHGAAEPVLHPR